MMSQISKFYIKTGLDSALAWFVLPWSQPCCFLTKFDTVKHQLRISMVPRFCRYKHDSTSHLVKTVAGGKRPVVNSRGSKGPIPRGADFQLYSLHKIFLGSSTVNPVPGTERPQGWARLTPDPTPLQPAVWELSKQAFVSRRLDLNPGPTM